MRFDSINMIYEAKDTEGNAAYYQYVKNADGTFSFYECNKNEESTTVVKREIVSDLSSVEDLNDWEYDVVKLEGGSYEIVYYDVKDAETVYTSKEEADNAVAEGGNKEIYSFDVVIEGISDAIEYPELTVEEPTEPIAPVDWETFVAENNIEEPDYENAPEVPVAPTEPVLTATEPTTEKTDYAAPTAPTEPSALDSKYVLGYWKNTFIGKIFITTGYDEDAYNADKMAYDTAYAVYQEEMEAYNTLMGEWGVYEQAVADYNEACEQYRTDKWVYDNITYPGYEVAAKAYNAVVEVYDNAVASYDEDLAAYNTAKAQYDIDKAVYDDAYAAYAPLKEAADTKKAEKEATLQACLSSGDILTIAVDGEEKEVKYNSVIGFYYDSSLNSSIPVPVDIAGYDVTITNTRTNYRVVEYTETTKVDFTKVDNEADDKVEKE